MAKANGTYHELRRTTGARNTQTCNAKLSKLLDQMKERINQSINQSIGNLEWHWLNPIKKNAFFFPKPKCYSPKSGISSWPDSHGVPGPIPIGTPKPGGATGGRPCNCGAICRSCCCIPCCCCAWIICWMFCCWFWFCCCCCCWWFIPWPGRLEKKWGDSMWKGSRGRKEQLNCGVTEILPLSLPLFQLAHLLCLLSNGCKTETENNHSPTQFKNTKWIECWLENLEKLSD